VLYAQPTYHNPTGTVLSPERRADILDVARACGAFIIEDDFARLLGHGTAPSRPLVADDRDGTVVYLTSLTKPAAPSLRVGALIARGPVRERLEAMRLVDDLFISRPLQDAAVDLLSSPVWDRHLRTLSTQLRQRCAALAADLARQVPDWHLARLPAGGLNLWLRTASDSATIAEAARELGVAVSPGRAYFAAEPSGNYLRMNFAAASGTAELTEAARRLARAAAHRVPPLR
jgi:DNA-binding transcriptional MocR family regulator